MHFINKKLAITLASIATLISQNPAQALWVKFTYEPGVTWEYKRAAEFAAYYWEDRITDDAIVNIHLDVAAAHKLPSGVLGGAIPAFQNNIDFSQFKTALTNDSSSSDDNLALNNLPLHGTNSWGAFIEGSTKDINKINLTRANAKALGLINSNDSDLDGTILLSDLSNVSYSWEDKRTDNTSSSEFDLTSVLIHEIGHIMGFVSGVDSVNAGNIGDRNKRLNYVTSLNLFSRDNGGSLGKNRASVVYGQNSYFTLDGGHTNLGYFSQGEDTNLGDHGKGDGWQASHWKSNINAMMNPILATGQKRGLTNLDLTAFDAIGWDRDSNNHNSDATLVNWADNWASNQGNVNRSSDLNTMFNQRGWGGGSRSTTYRQEMGLADYLHQEGLFQKGSAGALWSTFDPTAASESTSVPEPNSILALLGLSFFGFCSRQKK